MFFLCCSNTVERTAGGLLICLDPLKLNLSLVGSDRRAKEKVRGSIIPRGMMRFSNLFPGSFYILEAHQATSVALSFRAEMRRR